jgi:hypothetical protein
MCIAAAAAAAIAKPTRPNSFLQAAGGSAPGEGNRVPQPGRGGAPGAGGGRGRGRAPPRAPPVSVPNEDFDFEEMMKKFNKQAALKVQIIIIQNFTMSACCADICLCVYSSTPMVTPRHCHLNFLVQAWQPLNVSTAWYCCALCCSNAQQNLAQRSVPVLRLHCLGITARVQGMFGDYIKGSGYVDMLQEAESKPEQPKAAEKPTFEDDFFDSISSDATGAPLLPFALQQSCLLPSSKVAFCPPKNFSQTVLS